MVPPDKKNFANQLSFTGHAVTDRALSAPFPRHENQAKGAQALHPMGQAAGQNLALPEFTREINHLSGMMAEGEDSSSNSLISPGESSRTPAHFQAFPRMRSFTQFANASGQPRSCGHFT